MKFNSSLVASLVVVAVGFLGACSSDSHPPPLGSQNCSTPGCVPGGGGGAGGAGGSAGSGGAGGSWEGARADVTGTVFAMQPPRYWPIKGSEPELSKPAEVSIFAFGEEYVADYVPGEGFLLEQVPVGEFSVVARDVNDGNGILDTAIGAVVSTSNNWPVPAVRKSDLETVYEAVSEAIDASRAQVLFTISDCQNLTMLSGVKINVSEGADAIIYEDSAGWTKDETAGTGSHGLAFVVNVPAVAAPGKLLPIEYTYGGETVKGLSYRVQRGVVTRVHVSHGCSSP